MASCFSFSENGAIDLEAREIMTETVDRWNWDDLRLFLPVARSGRLTDAAAVLKLSISTVARRLTQLEADLGLSLFLRSQSGYALTEDGKRLLMKAEAVETAMFGVNRLADAVATKGRVRVALPEGFALQIILPKLARFRAAHPAISLDLVTGPFSLDLMRRESDIALRLVKPTDNDLFSRKLGRMAHAVYAARSLGGKERAALPKLGWLSEMRRLPIAESTAAWISAGRTVLPAGTHDIGEADLCLNSLGALTAAAKAGLGHALLPCLIGEAEPDLKRIDGPDGFFTQEVFLVLHRDLRHNPRIRAVADFLADCLTAASDRLAGRVSTEKAGSSRRN
jgi:DNA-binding transcriptional LysR family regulator